MFSCPDRGNLEGRLRYLRILFLATALVAAAPAAALAAGAVTVSSGDVLYTGDGGVNSVSFSDAAESDTQTRVTIREAGLTESPAVPGCAPNGPGEVRCTISEFNGVIANLGAGNDMAVSDGTQVTYRFDGGGGDDTLTGSDAVLGAAGFGVGDSLLGGSGDDTVSGRGGHDSLDGDDDNGDDVDGGSGDDEINLSTFDGADTLRGGPGFDTLDVTSTTFPETGFAVNLETQTVSRVDGAEPSSLESIEDVDGGDGDDRITGSAGANDLEGEEGNDLIDGLAGGDILEGEDGNDTIRARDGVNDRVLGGLGADTCELDQVDEHDGCESALVAQVPLFGTPPAPDLSGPRCSTSGLARRVSRNTILRRRWRFTIRCDEAGRVSVTFTARVKRLPKRVRFSAAGDLTLGTTRARLGRGNRVRVRLAPSRGLRSAIVRRRVLRLAITASDAAGNRRTITRRVTVR